MKALFSLLAIATLFGALLLPSSLEVQALQRRSVSGPVPVVQILLSHEAIESLRDAPRRDVAAAVRIDDEEFPKAVLHLKGEGSFQTVDQKPSLTLTLRKSDRTGANFFHKIHLNNSIEDSTFLQEMIAGDIFRAAGVPAAQAAHAYVVINGQARGLYVSKEADSKHFLASHFSHARGEVYDKNSLDLAQFKDVIEEANLEHRWQKLKQVLEVDEFISFLAAEVMICHWDGYGLGNNNFRVYRDPHSHRLTFLPSGMDQTFGNPLFPVRPDMSGPLARALVETPQGRAHFDTRLKQLVARFDPHEIIASTDHSAAKLRPFMSLTEFKELRGSLDDLSARVLARQKFLARELQISSL